MKTICLYIIKRLFIEHFIVHMFSCIYNHVCCHLFPNYNFYYYTFCVTNFIFFDSVVEIRQHHKRPTRLRRFYSFMLKIIIGVAILSNNYIWVWRLYSRNFATSCIGVGRNIRFSHIITFVAIGDIINMEAWMDNQWSRVISPQYHYYLISPHR